VAPFHQTEGGFPAPESSCSIFLCRQGEGLGPPNPLIDLLSIIYSAEQSLTNVTKYATSQMDETPYGCQSEHVCLRLEPHTFVLSYC